MVSLMMQSLTYVNIYYAGCANRAQENRFWYANKGVDRIMWCVFKTA